MKVCDSVCSIVLSKDKNTSLFLSRDKITNGVEENDFLVCKECGMYGDRDCFEDKSGPTCKQCTRVHCLQMSLDEAKESSKAVEKTLALVLERLSKLEGVCGQKKEGEV